MEFTPFELYWISRLDTVHTFLFAASVIAGALSVFLFVVMWAAAFVEDEDLVRSCKRRMGRILCVLVIAGLGRFFIPTVAEFSGWWG